MKLYLLNRIGVVDWDENVGFVIRANNEAQARFFASETSGGEIKSTWINDKLSSCIELALEGEQGVVLTDFNAG